MLTADQIEVLGEQARQITDPIIEFLIEDIARRVSEAGQLTGTASYQVWRLQQLGFSQRQLKKELRKRLKVSHRELRKLLTQAAEVGYDFDIRHLPYVQAVPFKSNDVIQAIVEAAVDMARSDLTNMVQTLGFVNHDGVCRPLTEAYEKACDFAFQKVAFGAQDYNSAVRGAVRELAAKGIQTIDYESGVHTSLEAAVRRNVMGGLGLMQERISQQNHDDLGCDGWEISAHAASAPDHEPIQGKQYSDAQYTALNNSLVRRIGTLNCGHAAFPIILGVNSPQYTPEQLEAFRSENEKGIEYEGRHYTMYEATQHQRKLERAIRKRKKKILLDEGLHDEQRLAQDQTKLVRLNEEYARFTKAAGLRSQRERTMVAGFGKRQAGAARSAAARNMLVKDPARFRDSVTIIPPFKGDAITHRSLHNNLAKSEVGRETVEFINSGKCSVEINYTNEAPEGVRGIAIGRSITVYAQNTRTIKATAKTLVHEVTHCKYDIGGNQWSEAVCFARELLHENGELTIADKRNIIKTVKELYPEYEWRKGGRRHGKGKSR